MNYLTHPCQKVNVLHGADNKVPEKVEFWGTDGDGKLHVMRAKYSDVVALLEQDKKAPVYGPDRDPKTGKILDEAKAPDLSKGIVDPTKSAETKGSSPELLEQMSREEKHSGKETDK